MSIRRRSPGLVLALAALLLGALWGLLALMEAPRAHPENAASAGRRIAEASAPPTPRQADPAAEERAARELAGGEPDRAGMRRDEDELASGIAYWGRATDSDGRPLRVQVCRQAGPLPPWRTSARSDDEGRFALHVPANDGGAAYLVQGGDWADVLIVPRPGYETPEAAETVVLERCASLEIVVRGRDGRVDAFVVAELEAPATLLLRPPAIPSLADDVRWREQASNGRILVERLPPDVAISGTAKLWSLDVEWFELAGRAPPPALEITGLELAPGERRTLSLDVLDSAEIRGTVRDESEQPVGDVELWLVRGTGHEASGPVPRMLTSGDGAFRRAAARSGSDGTFRFDDVPAGTWWIGIGPTPASPVREASRVRVLGEGPFEVELRIEPGRPIRGRLLASPGVPARGSVRLQGGGLVGDVVVPAGDDGSFSTPPLPPGEWIVLGVEDRTGLSSWAERAESGDTGIELLVRRAAVLRGRLVEARTGRPVDGEVRLDLRDMGAKHIEFDLRTRTSDGAFEFVGVSSNVWLDVEAEGGLTGGIFVSSDELLASPATEVVIEVH